jgi:acyl-CoA thioesterase-1
LPFLFLILMTCRAAAADTLLVLGDSLSAGYRMAASAAWPALLNDKWQSKTPVINASISGDTSQQGWRACLRCSNSISRAGCWWSWR